MTQPTIRTVAVVGTGVIGRSWIRVFARAGCETRAFDPDRKQLAGALEWARESAREDEALGFIDAGAGGGERRAIRRCDTLNEVLAGAGWVQESGPEALAVKQRIFAELDAAADSGAILASSTSAHDMSRIADDVAGAHRCVVAHPVNPPHVIPMVEVLPGEDTQPEVLAAALAFLESLGQSPVPMNRYLPGFLLNRLQAALVREAVFLYGTGAASAEAIDTVVRKGTGAALGAAGTVRDGTYERRWRRGRVLPALRRRVPGVVGGPGVGPRLPRARDRRDSRRDRSHVWSGRHGCPLRLARPPGTAHPGPQGR